MYHYYTNRGLDTIDILAQNFQHWTWWLPDLICNDVVDTIKKYVKNIEFYQINYDFTWSTKVNGNNPKIFYVIDFFGKETKVGATAPPHTVVIRDSVWFPHPFSPVEHNQIWFNSFRKIFRGKKGSSIVSPYRLSGINEVPNLFHHPSLTWQEMNIRFKNYYLLKEILSEYAIPDHNQVFPTVFPIRLKNRDKVLAGIDTPLPRMWQNKYNLPNDLYCELTFVPIDSRFNEESLTALADKIKELS
jgi:hypothetical protein